ncbi:orotate phosphoribosyltransferase [Candidatus Woesearchaeota archaeon]|nr:orotate phosphoribosyltransferase [Candidatus Woesearchaeota archaeon]
MENDTRLLLENCTVVNTDGMFSKKNIFIENGKITKIESNNFVNNVSYKVIDCTGKLVLPGLIDCHVHFRDPGFPEKEDFFTGSSAAAAGGVTSVLEMPNTSPTTFNRELLQQKRDIANHKSAVNYGFYIGAAADNLEELLLAENIAGIKVYMNLTTGKLIIENDANLQKIFSLNNKLFAVHAEGKTFAKALSLFHGNNSSKLYLCHTSLQSEIEMIRKEKAAGKMVYGEVCPHHLIFTKDDLTRLGGYGVMKPALATNVDRNALWAAINDGTIDVLATDHAPHTRAEKNCDNPAFGVIGIELLLPLALTWYHEGRLSLRKIIELCCENPCRIFEIKNKGYLREGYDADIVIVDLAAEKIVNDELLFSKAKGSPYNWMKLKGLPVITIVNGNIVFEDGRINESIKGKELIFEQDETEKENKTRVKSDSNVDIGESIAVGEDITEKTAEILLDTKAIIVNAEKPYRYVSGILSPIYCDNRILLSYPDKRKIIVESYLALLEREDVQFDVVAGVATAGIPWAAMIANRLDKPLIYVRAEKKEHGKQNAIEGELGIGQRVLVVEDLISTGGSSLKAVQQIRDAQGIVDNCIAIMNYEFEDSRNKFNEKGCTLLSLTNFSALSKKVLDRKYINLADYNKIKEWNTIPKEWGKKFGFE